MLSHGTEGLFLFLFCGNRLQIFGLEDLTAIQALDVIDAVAPGNHLGAFVVTSGLHIALR
jgi:hypothetical protein